MSTIFQNSQFSCHRVRTESIGTQNGARTRNLSLYSRQIESNVSESNSGNYPFKLFFRKILPSKLAFHRTHLYPSLWEKALNASVFRLLKFSRIECLILDAKHDDVKIANFRNKSNFRIISENCRNGYDILKMRIEDDYIWTPSCGITHPEFIEIMRMYRYFPFCRIQNNLNKIRLKIFLSFKCVIHINFLTSACVSLKWAISYPNVVRFSEVLCGSAKNVSLSSAILSLHPKEMSIYRKIFQGLFIFGEINGLFLPKNILKTFLFVNSTFLQK